MTQEAEPTDAPPETLHLAATDVATNALYYAGKLQGVVRTIRNNLEELPYFEGRSAIEGAADQFDAIEQELVQVGLAMAKLAAAAPDSKGKPRKK